MCDPRHRLTLPQGYVFAPTVPTLRPLGATFFRPSGLPARSRRLRLNIIEHPAGLVETRINPDGRLQVPPRRLGGAELAFEFRDLDV